MEICTPKVGDRKGGFGAALIVELATYAAGLAVQGVWDAVG